MGWGRARIAHRHACVRACARVRASMYAWRMHVAHRSRSIAQRPSCAPPAAPCNAGRCCPLYPAPSAGDEPAAAERAARTTRAKAAPSPPVPCPPPLDPPPPPPRRWPVPCCCTLAEAAPVPACLIWGGGAEVDAEALGGRSSCALYPAPRPPRSVAAAPPPPPPCSLPPAPWPLEWEYLSSQRVRHVSKWPFGFGLPAALGSPPPAPAACASKSVSSASKQVSQLVVQVSE